MSNRSNSYQINRFLNYSKGVIHVGASIGQERKQYRNRRLPVIWIEPIPEIFEQLEENIEFYRHQIAFKALITDKDNKKYKFYVTNNRGESSSIFKLKSHNKIWPYIKCSKVIDLKSITLNSLLKREKIDASKYDTLILDTQGSELLVLKGADLTHVKYIKIEVPNFESYKGCCQVKDIEKFMRDNRFKKVAWKDQVCYIGDKKVLGRKGGRNYYDLVYKKRGK